MKRAHIGLKTKLASALLALGDVDYEHAKLMSEDQILSLYQWDHGILHAIEPNDTYWNLRPALINPHRQKSRGDTRAIAKVKRLSKQQEEFQRQLLTPTPKDERPKSKWGSRPFSSKARDRIKKRK